MATSEVRFPRLFRVRQTFDRPRVNDVEGAVRDELRRVGVLKKIAQADRVAITAGSRGIANIPAILRAVADQVRAAGGRPFLVPAMGSHGGGTADGQQGVLSKLGITEASCGCPIEASMETVVIATAPQGFPVHFDRIAHEADHVIVCNRVKPHTTFDGSIESGLLKMMLIGLGKHAGARIYHRAILDYRFDEIVHTVGELVLRHCPILAGLAIVENAYEETAHIEAVRPAEFVTREPELLELARRSMPSLPFDPVDLLMIDRIGKDISGTGFDTNLVGRKEDPSTFGRDGSEAADRAPAAHIRYISVRDLTDGTSGNACGIGLVEYCRRRVLEKMDAAATRINAITAGHVAAAKLAVDFDTDREILEHALTTAGLAPPEQARVLWIPDTLHVAEVECSESYWDEAQRRNDLEIVSPCRPLPIDDEGNLPDDWFGAAAITRS